MDRPGGAGVVRRVDEPPDRCDRAEHIAHRRERQHLGAVEQTIEVLKNRVDLYKQNPGGPFRDFVDFKIGYGTPTKQVKKFLQAVFEKSAESTKGMEREKTPMIALKENGDHAARWRLAYTLSNPHRLLSVRDALNLAAYELQEKFGLSVSTPTTHVVETPSGNPAKTSSKAEITSTGSSS